jgi:hypothetical protein
MGKRAHGVKDVALCLAGCLHCDASLLVVVFFDLSQCMPCHSFQQTQEEYDDVNFQVTLLDNEISNKDDNSAMSKLVH